MPRQRGATLIAMKLAVFAVSVLVASSLSTGQVQAPKATAQAVPAAGDERSQPDTGTGEIPTFYSHARQVLVTASVWKHEARTSAWIPNEVYKRDPKAAEVFATPPEARGLSANDFRIFDNGAEQKINYLQEADFSGMDVTRTWSYHPDIRGTWGYSFFQADVGLRPPVATYIIGYIPPPSQGGDCHTIRVVAGDNDVLLNRTGYCNTDGGNAATDEGSKLAAQMEKLAKSTSHGSLKVTSRAFVFWSSGVLSLIKDSPGIGVGMASPAHAANLTYVVVVHDSRAPATVQIATEYELWRKVWDAPCPSDNPAIQVLGVVYKANGEVAARFRDSYPCRMPPAYLALGGHGQRGFGIPGRFYTQLDLRPGDYDVHVVVADGQRIGQAQMPLRVNPIDDQAFTISDIALNGILRDASLLLQEAAFVSPAPLLPTPLVSKQLQFIPAPDAKVQKGSSSSLYFEIYEPLLADRSAEVHFRIKITDLKTGSLVVNTEPTSGAQYVIPGNEVIPIALRVDTAKLRSGSYEIAIQASDSTGRESEWRTAKFEIK